MSAFPPLGRHSPRFRALRRLVQARRRRREGRFLAEGPRVVAEALRAGAPLELLLVSDPLGDPHLLRLARRAAARGCEVRTVEAGALELLSPARTSQGLLAVATLPPDRPALEGDLVCLLEEVGEPGNTGALLRAALGAGAASVLLCGGADPYAPRAVRASAGALFHLPLARMSREEALSALRASGHLLVGAAARGGEDLFTSELPRRCAVVLGSEVRGLSPGLLDAVDRLVTVPLTPSCESLNVAVAGALVLFEHRRRWGYRCCTGPGRNAGPLGELPD